MLKKRGSISPRVLMEKRNFITVASFPSIIQILLLDSWNIKIVWTIVQFIDVFYSLIPFNLPVEIVFLLFSSYYIDHSLLKSLCLLCLKFLPCIIFYCFNACDDRPGRQIRCTDHCHDYNRF